MCERISLSLSKGMGMIGLCTKGVSRHRLFKFLRTQACQGVHIFTSKDSGVWSSRALHRLLLDSLAYRQTLRRWFFLYIFGFVKGLSGRVELWIQPITLVELSHVASAHSPTLTSLWGSYFIRQSRQSRKAQTPRSLVDAFARSTTPTSRKQHISPKSLTAHLIDHASAHSSQGL